MNMPLALLNRRRRGGFSPSALFALAEPGVWFDPSDLSTLYQDTAGTTPVTTTGQSVGLMLDKSKGLVLGPELVTNGDFSSGTGWTTNTGWSITGGAAVGAAVSTSLFGGGVTPVAGRTYRVDFDVISYTSGSLFVTVGGNFSGNPSLTGAAMAPGRKSVYVVSGSSPSRGVEFYGGSIAATIDNISVKELPGNHAVQATTANRPIYGIHPFGGRRNLLVRTEEFGNASWPKTGVTVESGPTSPVGTATASTVSETSTTGFHFLRQDATVSAGTYTLTVYLKAGTQRYGGAHINFDGTARGCSIDLQNGTLGTPYGGATAVRDDVGNGWYRLRISATASAPISSHVAVFTSNANSLSSYAGNATNNILVWGAQLETGSTATAYQRVTDQYNVTEAGVPSVSYLFFDGVNDSLATPTITPGVDKAQVFAGVRKLSDAAQGIAVELSATSLINAGSFAIRAPSGATAQYGFISGGTALSAPIASGFAAPITNIVTGIGDIAGDVATIRVDGVERTTSATNQGTGNYLAYPLYIGARGGSGTFFSGHLYSVIARFGPNLDTGQISSTETWVAGKTGITI
jgi:hypothetical protein